MPGPQHSRAWAQREGVKCSPQPPEDRLLPFGGAGTEAGAPPAATLRRGTAPLKMVPLPPQVSPGSSRPIPKGPFGTDCKRQPCSVAEQLEMVAATAGALRFKGSAGGNVLLSSGGSFPSKWRPCCLLPVQWFCHLSVPSTYFTVLGSFLQSWPGFLLSLEGFLFTLLVIKEF